MTDHLSILDVKSRAKLAETSPEEMEAIIAQLNDDDPRRARDAAWVMTHFTQQQIASLQPRQDKFIDKVLHTDNTALRRLLMNIIERQEFHEEDLRTDFLDFCLAHMASPDEPPGVQTLCMKLAYRQCQFFPELLREFRLALTLMPTDGYAVSITGLRRKLLKATSQLDKEAFEDLHLKE